MAASVKANSNMFTLPLCCDSVEWCRYPALNSIIAVGHYELTPNQGKIGGVTLFEHKSSDESFERVSFNETPPILDLKWHSFDGHQAIKLNEEEQKDTSDDGKAAICLSAATSIGTIELYTLDETKRLQLKHKSFIPNIESDENKDAAPPICLSLDWNQMQNDLCVTSLSDGSIAVLQFNDTGKVPIISRMKWHSDQVWTACFDKYNAKVSYSGADDCLFCVHDYRNKQIIHKDDSTHKMGVCCITDSFYEEHLLLTGSYDEYLRIWDKRNMQKPMDSLKFEDGVWRIKWNPNQQTGNKILIATMRDHFNIVRVEEETKKLTRLYCYEQHFTNYPRTKTKGQDKNDEEELDILAYGCDWSTTNWVASCSFYDKQFHCWKSS